MKTTWFLIVNPSSGSSRFTKVWSNIQSELNKLNIDYDFAFTKSSKDEIRIVKSALKNGFQKLIVVGGDGTLHHVLNGIFKQNTIRTNQIKLGIIPIGTGNDWIKTYNIPNSIQKAIAVINNDKTATQDVGLIHNNSTKEYFINVAGIGYDGYVVQKLQHLKKLGSISYLISGLYGLLFYKKSNYIIKTPNETYTSKCLMVLFGICSYSGGGMKMTKDANPNDGLLDVTIAKDFSFFDLVFNLPKIYNGKIIHHSKVINLKTDKINVIDNKQESLIEADGELVGRGSTQVSIIPKSIQVFVKS